MDAPARGSGGGEDNGKVGGGGTDTADPKETDPQLKAERRAAPATAPMLATGLAPTQTQPPSGPPPRNERSMVEQFRAFFSTRQRQRQRWSGARLLGTLGSGNCFREGGRFLFDLICCALEIPMGEANAGALIRSLPQQETVDRSLQERGGGRAMHPL